MTLPPNLLRYWRILSLVVGIICLAFLAESNGNRLNIEWLYTAPTHLQFAWLVAGSVLVALGLSAPRRAMPSLVTQTTNSDFHTPDSSALIIEPPDSSKTSHWQIWMLGAILLLAFVVRAVNLEQSVFLYVDEFGSADVVADLRASDQDRLLLPYWDVAGWSRVYAYMQTFGVDLFGTNLTGLRATTVLIGTLTAWAVYLLAAELFDRRLALLAAFWLATFPPHIHFSRLGIPNAVDPLFGTLALAFLARGGLTGKRNDFVLAGIMLGLTQYFYEAGRLIFPLVAIGFALALIMRDRKARPVRQPQSDTISPIKGTGLMLLGALLVAFPGYYALIANNMSVATRFSQMNVLGAYFDALRSNPVAWLHDIFAPPFLHLVILPDTSRLYYGGDYGLILPWIVPLFLLGVVYALRNLRRPGMFMLLLWVFGVALGNGFIEQNAYSSRFVVIFPALVLFIVAGIHVLIVRWRPYQRWIVAAALILAGLQIPYYFGPHLTLYNQQIRPYYDFAEIVPRARDFPPRTQLHLITNDATSLWQVGVLQRYFGTNLPVDVLALKDLTEAYLDHLPRNVDHAFFVVPQDTVSIELIQRHFDAGNPQPSPNNVPLNRQYFMIYVKAAETNPNPL